MIFPLFTGRPLRASVGAIPLLAALLLPAAALAQGRPDVIWMRGGTWSTGGYTPSRIALSPDGVVLASIGRLSLRLWNTNTGLMLRTVDFDRHPVAIAMDESGGSVFILLSTGFTTGHVQRRRTSDGALLVEFPISSSPSSSGLLSTPLLNVPNRNQVVFDNRVFDASSGVLQHTLPGTILGISDDGTTAAARFWNRSGPGVVTVVRTSDWTAIRSFTQSRNPNNVRFSPDGQIVVVNRSVRRVADGTEIAALDGISDSEAANFQLRLRFTPDGTRLLVGCPSAFPEAEDCPVDSTLVRVFSTSNWQRTPGLLSGPDNPRPADFAVGPGGLLITADGYWRLRKWRVESTGISYVFDITHPFFEGLVNGIAASPSGDQLIIATSGDKLDTPDRERSQEGLVQIYRAADGVEQNRFRDDLRLSTPLYSSDGSQFAFQRNYLLDAEVNSQDTVIDVRQTSDGHLLHTVPDRNGKEVRFMPDGQSLVLGKRPQNHFLTRATGISRVQITDSSVVWHALRPDGCDHTQCGYSGTAVVSPDGTLVYAGTDRGIAVLDASTGVTIGLIALRGGGTDLEISADGSLLADGAIRVLRASNGNVLMHRRLPCIPTGVGTECVENGISSIAFSPDGPRLLVAAGDGLRVFDVSRSVMTHYYTEEVGANANAVFIPQTSNIAYARGDGTLVVARLPDAMCTPTLVPSTISFAPSGGTQRVKVEYPQNGCRWTASTNATWLGITNGSGTSDGEFDVTVAANVGETRSGVVMVAGIRLPVMQAASTCTFSVSPSSLSIPSAGDELNVTVTTQAGCRWWPTIPDKWVTFADGSGVGAGAAYLEIEATVLPRRTTITIGGQPIEITQAGECSLSVSPRNATVEASGGSGQIAVTGATFCTWTASSSASWLTITAGNSGSGNGSVAWLAATNPTTSSRVATLMIAGQTVTITQLGLPCTYTLDRTSAGVPALGATSEVILQTLSGCAWTATSSVSWLTLSGRTTGSGPAVIDFTVMANTAAAVRSGTIHVANVAFAVTQQGISAGEPDPPRNLVAQVFGARLTLAWTPAGTGAAPTMYEIEAGTTSGATNVVRFSTGSTATSFSTATMPLGTYFLRVRAINAAGRSVPSNEVTAVIGIPGQPGGLTATVTGNSVTLAWQSPTSGGGPSTYIIEAGSGEGLNNLASFSTGTTMLTFAAGGVPDGRYFVRVRAANAFGIGETSNEVTFAVGSSCLVAPSAPSTLAATVTGFHVQLTWQQPSMGNAISYRLEAGSRPGVADLAILDTGNASREFFATAPPGIYYLRVRAVNACGVSPASPETLVTVLP